MESATENNRLRVRVKTGGKSTRHLAVMVDAGKPHEEQDKVSMSDGSFRFKHAGMSPREMIANFAVCRIQNPAYCLPFQLTGLRACQDNVIYNEI